MRSTLAFSTCVSLRPLTARFAYGPAVPITPTRPLFINASAQSSEPATVPKSVSARRMPAIMGPVVPNASLLEFNVEDRAQLRSDVLRKLSDYVKKNNLQDPENKRMVKCNKELTDLFGVDNCSILQMSKYVTPHLRKPSEAGGRYVDEARRVEEEWGKNNPAGEAGQKGKRRTRRSSPADEKNMKDGRKIFKPVILSDDLAAICRAKEMPRQQIVKAIWEYIRMNNLKGEPGEPIKCDFLLRKVYNTDTIDVKTIMKGIGNHVTKKD